MTRRWMYTTLVLTLPVTLACAGCSGSEAKAGKEVAPPAPSGIEPQKVADMLHAVMKADRTVYTKQIVNRLVKQQKLQVMNPESKQAEPFRASEQWKSEHGRLPLPAQVFRMGAELVTDADVGFSYGLLSKWPINKQNKPKTDIEVKGLDAVDAAKGATPFYGQESLGGKNYFTAVYADVAVADACVDCHNDHTDTPRDDFKLGDVMGGVVLRIPLDG